MQQTKVILKTKTVNISRKLSDFEMINDCIMKVSIILTILFWLTIG